MQLPTFHFFPMDYFWIWPCFPVLRGGECCWFSGWPSRGLFYSFLPIPCLWLQVLLCNLLTRLQLSLGSGHPALSPGPWMGRTSLCSSYQDFIFCSPLNSVLCSVNKVFIQHWQAMCFLLGPWGIRLVDNHSAKIITCFFLTNLLNFIA